MSDQSFKSSAPYKETVRLSGTAARAYTLPPPPSDDNDEVEIKFLVPENPKGTVDDSIFSKMESFFREKGLIAAIHRKYLASRQLDTAKRTLHLRGITLRTRGEYENNDLGAVNTPDVCLKMNGWVNQKSAALCRREFETAVRNFKRAELPMLLKAFPRHLTPEVHAALEGIEAADLREFFQIQCLRSRILIKIPEELTGISRKTVIGELQLDDSRFIVPIKGLSENVLIGRDLEVEMELLETPCAYDRSRNARSLVCSRLTEEEKIIAFRVANDLIQQASGNVLVHNRASKADRGFKYLDKSNLEHHLDTYTPRIPEQRRIQPAFACPVGRDIYSLIGRDWKPLSEEIEIATFQPQPALA